jgi:hypothetical protein
MRGSSVIVRTRPLTVRFTDAGAMGDSPLGALSVAAYPNPGFRRIAHLVLATSAALIPSNASPYPTPSSTMRRSF